MARFEPAPTDDHVGRDFDGFPELAAALGDLAKPKALGPDRCEADPLPRRPTPEEVEARLAAEEDAGGSGGD